MTEQTVLASLRRQMNHHEHKMIKLARVASDLAFHPKYIGRYFSSTGIFGPATPLELGLPWFSFSAIDFLESYVTKGMSIFEYGSGGSTVYFAKRARSVTSTEDNQEWLSLVRNKLETSQMTNVTLQHHPFDFHNVRDFETSSYLRSIPGEAFDIIVVDGTEEITKVRPTCFYFAEDKVKKGGIIVVDDSWRYPELRNKNRAKQWKEHAGTGPGRHSVTSTDIYFY